jgi:hypothetical protein
MVLWGRAVEGWTARRRGRLTPRRPVGFVNGIAALNYLAEQYSDAAEVVVVGKTMGSVAAPIYAGLAADLLPGAELTVFGADSGHIPDDPDRNAEFGELWGAYATMPDWEVNQGLTARDWGPRRLSAERSSGFAKTSTRRLEQPSIACTVRVEPGCAADHPERLDDLANPVARGSDSCPASGPGWWGWPAYAGGGGAGWLGAHVVAHAGHDVAEVAQVVIGEWVEQQAAEDLDVAGQDVPDEG